MLLNICQNVGKNILNACELIGNFLKFMGDILFVITRKNIYWRNIWSNIVEIGFYSLPVVGITAIFTGAVLALQSYSGFTRFSAESAIATVVVLSITRELGPVLAGLMVAGRVGASIAAEIGTMKVTEQLDALSTLSTSPHKYLFLPKIIATTLVLPILVFIADIIGIMGGYLVSVYILHFESIAYLKNTIRYLEFFDVVSGLIKATVFGFIISSISCYCGFNSQKGAAGVGKATTSAVVMSSMLILCSTYFITKILFD